MVPKNGKHIRPPAVEFTCRTDASLLDWGAIEMSKDCHANGRLNIDESVYAINYLKLLDIYYALQSFYKDQRGVHIQIQSDNVAAFAYINEMGGIASLIMDALSSDIWQWCLQRNIFVSASYIPGSSKTADFYSRIFF